MLQLPMQAAIAEAIVAPGEQDPADIMQDDQSSHADSDMEEEDINKKQGWLLL